MRRGRRIGIGALALAAVAAIWGCGGSDETGQGVTAPREPGLAGNGSAANRRDVGDGAGGVALDTVGNFDHPVYLTQPAAGDDDHLYVVEQCGRILRLPLEGGETSVFLDLSELVTCGGEQGLLSVAFDPRYERSGLFYVNYTDTEGDSRTVEYRRASSDPGAADPASAREILRIEDFASNHNGGQLLFGPDGSLYLGMGDGGGTGDPNRTAQDPDSPLGKLLRLDPDRPGSFELAAIGLRNPWRFSFDPPTDSVWIGDVGQDQSEEIDTARIEDLGPTLNFGWSAFEGSRRYNEDQRAADAVAPVIEYGHDGGGCSVTGGYVVRDRELSSLQGRYLYGDFCAGELRSFPADPADPADDRALGLEVRSLSSFATDRAGHVYAISLEGPVYRLVADRG